MRQVLLSDAIHLAAALSQYPLDTTDIILDQWVTQTRAAAKYLRRFGRPHPAWGDGSLTSRAIKAAAQAHETSLQGRAFFQALGRVAHHLARIGQDPRQGLS